MELDNMKQMWQKLDETIERQNIMNEKLIRNMMYERTGNAVRILSNTEHLGFITGVLLLIVLLSQVNKMDGSTGVIISYVFTLIIGVASTIFGWYKIQILSKLNIHEAPVAQLTEQTERFRMMIIKERLIFIILGPLLIGAFYIVMTKMVNGIDVFDNIGVIWPKVLFATVLYIVILLGVYNQYYFRNIRQIKKSLDEVKAFLKN